MEKEKRLPVFIYYYVTLIFLELIFRIFCTNNIFHFTLLHTLLYFVPLSFILALCTKLLKEKLNRIVFFVFIGLLCFWYSVELVFKEGFDVYFSIATMGLADQAVSFLGDAIKMVFTNLPKIILLWIPFILTFFLQKQFLFHRIKKKKAILGIIMIVFSTLLFRGSLWIGKKQAYSPYELYHHVADNSLNIEKLGVMPATLLELKRSIFGFEESMMVTPPVVEPPASEDPEIPQEDKYNITDINFEELIAKEGNKTIKSMHQYFASDTGTKQNKYTNYFGGKNLVLFMAESFNSIGVSKELTPTLYKLTHESFVFENFYSPVILSTIGGEFQELTGTYPQLDLLSNVWRKGKNYYPYGFGTVFQGLGYNTYAYHNNQYTFQDRNVYLNSIGFSNYKGCGNGLEDLMDCTKWPESDVEMIEATIGDYINSDKPFMTYYATVSGHMGYNWGNAMSRKHKDAVKGLPYSEPVKAYIATQIELDQALELLIKKLDEAGKLDDTVIALVGDHYPYALTVNEMNEASTYERDDKVEINRSNFILWNSKTPTTTISKVGSQIDVLPTILNIFGVKYDSRLIVGKDILSNTPGLAMFDNRSWVSDYGTYFTATGKFVPKEGVEIPDNYVSNMNKIVSSRITMSRNIIEQNYYQKVIK